MTSRNKEYEWTILFVTIVYAILHQRIQTVNPNTDWVVRGRCKKKKKSSKEGKEVEKTVRAGGE